MQEFFQKNNKLISSFLKNLIFLSIFLLFLEYFTPIFVTKFISPKILLFIIFFCSSTLLFLHIKKDEFTYSLKLEPIFKYLFLFFLLLITLSSLNFEFLNRIDVVKMVIGFLNKYVYILSLFGISTGFFTFYFNKERIDREIEEEEKKEKDNEERRKKEFEYKYEKINRIPVLRNIVKWMYREGWWYSIGLVVIVVIFVFLRISTFSFNISDSSHYDKFRSTIPAAVTANIEKDFFYNNNSFYHTVDSKGSHSSSYNRFPLYVLISSPLVHITDYISLGSSIRVLLLIVDVLILVQVYLFFLSIFNKKFALMGLFLLSVNFFFVFSFAIPVEDKFSLLFFLLGVNNLLAHKHFNAYLWGGLSFLAKEPFLLITVPFYIVIEIFRLKEKKKEDVLREVFQNTTVFVTPFLLFNFLIKDFPVMGSSQRIFSIFITLLILGGVYFCYKKSSQINLNSKRIHLLLSIFLLVLVVPFIITISRRALALSEGFLVNTENLFNLRIYGIILDQIVQRFFGDYVLIFLILGILIILINLKKNRDIIALLSGSLAYLIIASTSIAFHEYYRHIFVVLFVAFMILVFHRISKSFASKKLLFLYICILSLSFFFTTYSNTSEKLEQIASRNRIEGLEKASEFLNVNTNLEEKIIYSDLDLSIDLFFLALRNPANFNNDLVREEIAKDGFTQTLNNYNVNYFVSKGPSDFSGFLDMFEEIQKTINPSRREMIRHRLRIHTPGSTRGFDLRSFLRKEVTYIDSEYALRKYNPGQYFLLEETIGDIYIYKLKQISLP